MDLFPFIGDLLCVCIWEIRLPTFIALQFAYINFIILSQSALLRKNDFAEGSKILLDIDLKIIYVGSK